MTVTAQITQWDTLTHFMLSCLDAPIASGQGGFIILPERGLGNPLPMGHSDAATMASTIIHAIERLFDDPACRMRQLTCADFKALFLAEHPANSPMPEPYPVVNAFSGKPQIQLQTLRACLMFLAGVCALKHFSPVKAAVIAGYNHADLEKAWNQGIFNANMPNRYLVRPAERQLHLDAESDRFGFSPSNLFEAIQLALKANLEKNQARGPFQPDFRRKSR